MKLDPRIQNIRDVLTPFDDGSTLLTGEYCAFANDIETFNNLDECTFGTLKRVNGDENFPFEFEVTVSHRTGTAKFCLPYHKVKKSYRQFISLGEFLEKFPLGSVIRYKVNEFVKTQLFTEYWTDEEGNVFIKLSDDLWTLEELFGHFMLIEGEESHPFGVKE